MIKVVVMDADGVIVHGKSFKEKLELEYGITPETTADFFTDEWFQCLAGDADLKKSVAPHLETWGWKKGVEQFVREWFTFEHNINEELIKYIQELRKKGIKVYVGTNQETYRTEYMLSIMGFAYTFDGMFSSAHLGAVKPAHEFFTKVYAGVGTGVAMNEVLVWDDLQSNVDAAREFGFLGELYISFAGFKEKMKTYLPEA
jgi:putative hydrolase of the HAD superfamily